MLGVRDLAQAVTESWMCLSCPTYTVPCPQNYNPLRSFKNWPGNSKRLLLLWSASRCTSSVKVLAAGKCDGG